MAPVALHGQSPARGAVKTDTLWSQSLGARKQFLVWLPPSYAASPARRYPVAYYLHGLWGAETDWVRQGRLDHTLDSLVAAGLPEMIVVLPDGDDGWYTTWNWIGDWSGCRRAPPRHAGTAGSYCVPWLKYDEYIVRDLVARVDSAYRTQPTRDRRAIAGLSMGGYGAITLALAYPEVFAAAASHSGVLSPLAGPRPATADSIRAPDIAALRARWGDDFWPLIAPAFGRDTMGWRARDPVRFAERARRTGAPIPALFADVGTDDAFLSQNRLFRDAMARLGVPLEHREWPGGHTWDYWRRHSVESLRWLAERIAR